MSNFASTGHASPSAPPQYGVGPFSLREVVLGGAWALSLLISLFAMLGSNPLSVWDFSWLWVSAIVMPAVALVLLVVRRLRPAATLRVGSLGVDQFASVAFSLAAFALGSVLVDLGGLYLPWNIVFQLVLMLVGVAATVGGPFIPPFSEDFTFRPQVPAHRVAAPARPIAPRPEPAPVARPAQGQPSQAQPTQGQSYSGQGQPTQGQPSQGQPSQVQGQPAPGQPRAGQSADTQWSAGAQSAAAQAAASEQPAAAEPAEEPSAPEASAAEQPSVPQAFWILAPEVRDVVDGAGSVLFQIGPSDWALVLEDRGTHFVMRSDDERTIGFLYNTSDVTRG